MDGGHADELLMGQVKGERVGVGNDDGGRGVGLHKISLKSLIIFYLKQIKVNEKGKKWGNVN